MTPDSACHEDLAFLSVLFALLPAPPRIAGFEEIVTLLRASPDIAAINASRYHRGQAGMAGASVGASVHEARYRGHDNLTWWLSTKGKE